MGAEKTSMLVMGASFAGLFVAAAAAGAGVPVTIVDRDELADDAAPRPGVPQGRQPHILLHRGLQALETLLPGISDELRAAGGVSFDTGQMPQQIAQGWLPQGAWAESVVSLSRTRLELIVRRRVQALPAVTVLTGVQVRGLGRTEHGWEVIDEHGGRHRAAWAVDASGRGSRLPQWLRSLGVDVPEPEVVEAKLGYACRTYVGELPFRTGVLLAATDADPAGGSALPIEQGRWIICAAGYGERRPGRDATDFEPYLRSLLDPALADIARVLRPDSEVAVHRQTGNRRHTYGSQRDWPAGLLVVGDALCAFNPVYGQGITVAAMQAEHLGRVLTRRPGLEPARSRRLQQQLSRRAALPWSVSTGEDRKYLGGVRPRWHERLTSRWIGRVADLAVGGDIACCQAFGRLYHLMASPTVLVGPRVVAAVVASWARPIPPAQPRPPALNRVSDLARAAR